MIVNNFYHLLEKTRFAKVVNFVCMGFEKSTNCCCPLKNAFLQFEPMYCLQANLKIEKDDLDSNAKRQNGFAAKPSKIQNCKSKHNEKSYKFKKDVTLHDSNIWCDCANSKMVRITLQGHVLFCCMCL